MPQFRITEAVSLRRVKKTQFLHYSSSALLQFFFFSDVQRTSDSPAQLPLSCTPPTHTSHHLAQLRRARPSFRYLHRTVVASPAPSRRFLMPLRLLLLRPTIIAAAPSRSRALPLELLYLLLRATITNVLRGFVHSACTATARTVEEVVDERLAKIQREDERLAKLQQDEDERLAKIQQDEVERLAKAQLEEDEQLAWAIQESLTIGSPPRSDNDSSFLSYPHLFPPGYR